MLLLLLLILVLLLVLLLLRRRILVHKVASIRVWVGRQHVGVVVLLGAVDGLWEGGGSSRIDSGIRGIEVVLVVECEVEAQAVVVVVHRNCRPSTVGRSPRSLACPMSCQVDLTGMSGQLPVS